MARTRRNPEGVTYLVHELVVVGVKRLLHWVLTHALLVLLRSLGRGGAGSGMAASLLCGRAVPGAGLLGLDRTSGRCGHLNGRLHRTAESARRALLRCTRLLLSVGLSLVDW